MAKRKQGPEQMNKIRVAFHEVDALGLTLY
jgi:hypothetical protein